MKRSILSVLLSVLLLGTLLLTGCFSVGYSSSDYGGGGGGGGGGSYKDDYAPDFGSPFGGDDDDGYEEDTPTDNVDVYPGDVITFGAYSHYDPNTYEPVYTPIEWYVLDVDDGKMLILSKYMLDACLFTFSPNGAMWSSSNPYDLAECMWEESFTYLERQKVTSGTIMSNGESYTPTEEVFLLSGKEYQEYENVVTDIYDCYYIPGVEENDTYIDGGGRSAWWIRDDSIYGCYMDTYGDRTLNTIFNDYEFGFRPAMWISTDYEIEIDGNAKPDKAFFGKWVHEGGDSYYCNIYDDNTIELVDGPDSVVFNYFCYSSTIIVAYNGEYVPHESITLVLTSEDTITLYALESEDDDNTLVKEEDKKNNVPKFEFNY